MTAAARAASQAGEPGPALGWERPPQTPWDHPGSPIPPAQVAKAGGTENVQAHSTNLSSLPRGRSVCGKGGVQPGVGNFPKSPVKRGGGSDRQGLAPHPLTPTALAPAADGLFPQAHEQNHRSPEG